MTVSRKSVARSRSISREIPRKKKPVARSRPHGNIELIVVGDVQSTRRFYLKKKGGGEPPSKIKRHLFIQKPGKKLNL